MKTILLILFFGFDGNLTFATQQQETESKCADVKAMFNNFEYDTQEFSGVDIKCVDKKELIEELNK